MRGVGRTRPPAVAGMFYPADAGRLQRVVDDALAAAAAAAARIGGEDTAALKALIVPHAGYVYSGPIAATAYARLRRQSTAVSRVVLLGPAHRVPLRGLAVPTVDAFTTPLGDIAVDDGLRARALALPGVVSDDDAHAAEHSIEVQLPFLQRVLADGFTLLPVAVGDVAAADVTQLLDAVWGGPETLIVVSSDLSHYLDAATARIRDDRTAAAIEAGEGAALGPYDACGYVGVRGLLTSVRRHGLQAETLDLRTSADTAGEPDRTVGYGAFAFRPAVPERTIGQDAGQRTRPNATGVGVARATPPAIEAGSLDDVIDRHGVDLLAIARMAIDAAVHTGRRIVPDLSGMPTGLAAPGASFVTLRSPDGDLLGCIGSLEPHRPLAVDVAQNAIAAALDDPRMPPLTPSEFATMHVHLSVLGPRVPIAAGSYAELVSALVPGADGVVISGAGVRATLLASVWEQLPDADRFCAALWHKAGLAPGRWPRGLRAERYACAGIADPD